ncbi:MAG: TolC family protein [Bryobacterales bacterium]|nr:TolC family protein [Bryobacterales bacterium]
MGRIASFLLLLLMVADGVHAQERLHWRDLLAELEARNPSLEAAQKTLEAMRQRAPQAGSLPDPMVGIRSLSMPSPLPFQGLGSDPMITAGLMVSQQFPARGTRKLRYQIAQTEAQAERGTYEQVWNTLVGELQRAWVEYRYAFDALTLLDENQRLFGEVLRASEARYAVGEGSQRDLLQAQTQLSLLATRRERLEQGKRVAEAKVNALLGREPFHSLPPPAIPSPAAPPAEITALIEGLPDTSPLLERAAKQIEARGLGVALARKSYQPETKVSGTYMNRGGYAPMWELSLEFSVPAWFRSKQRPEVAERTFELAAARREYEATLQDLGFQVREQYEAARTAGRLMEIYDDTVIPQARLALESSMEGYETGKADFLNVLSGFVTLVDYRMAQLDERRNLELAVSRIGELTGKELLP